MESRSPGPLVNSINKGECCLSFLPFFPEMSERLQKSILRNNIAEVKQAIEEGDDINATFKGFTPLFVACLFGKRDIIRLLLDQPNIDVNALVHEKHTALSAAVAYGDPDIFELFVRHKKTNFKDPLGVHPMHAIIHHKKHFVLKKWIRSGVPLVVTDQMLGYAEKKKATGILHLMERFREDENKLRTELCAVNQFFGDDEELEKLVFLDIEDKK